MAGYVTIGRMLANYPKLKVTLHVGNWREVTSLVAEKKVDVGVAELTDAVLDDALKTELVGQHLGHYFCRPGHPILDKRRVRLADLLKYPWATNRMPQRIASAFPRPAGVAGQIDPFNGDFVPAVELDVPMQLASLISSSDVIAAGSFTMVEKELDAGMLAVISTPELKFRSGYGFIYRKDRSLSPATQAFMHEFREQEKLVTELEQRFERRFIA
jgi:DNA-binding transcriptional LysR family regulator